MKIKSISKLLTTALLLSSLNSNSFAGVLSEDRRYETFEGEDITVDNILEEGKAYVEIEGNALVNEIDYSKVALLNNGAYYYNNGKIINTNTDDHTYWGDVESISKRIKSNSNYTFCIENLSDFDINVEVRTNTEANTVLNKTLEANSKNKFLINSGELSKGIYYKHFCSSKVNTNSTVSLMVLEGDWTDKELPSYFEGVKYVGENESGKHSVGIKSANKNFIDLNKIDIGTWQSTYTINGDGSVTIRPTATTGVSFIHLKNIFLPKNSSYVYSAKIEGLVGDYGNPVWNAYSTVPVDIPLSTSLPYDRYVAMGLYVDNSSLDNYLTIYPQLEAGNTETDYAPSMEIEKSFDLIEPLKGIPDGVKDRMITNNERNILEIATKEVVLNGSENWSIGTAENGWTIYDDSSVFYTDTYPVKGNSLLMADKLETVRGAGIGAINKMGITNQTWGNIGHIAIRVPNSYLQTIDERGFINWLKDNPIKVLYALDSPEYKDVNISSKIYIFKDITHISVKSEVPTNIKVTVDRVANRAKEAIELAKANPTVDNISQARFWSNLMKDSTLKDEFQEQISTDTMPIDLTIEKKKISANADVYIKMKNTLSLSLDTNSITFEDFNASEDMEKKNAVNLIISSSLPYKVNASLESEIYNADKSATIDKSVLNIKNSSDTTYKAFNRVSEALVLLDNQIEGDNIHHSLDLILKGGSTHKADVYKTTIKFEVEQK